MSAERSDTFIDQLHAKRAHEFLESIFSTFDRDRQLFIITVIQFKAWFIALLWFLNFLVSFIFAKVFAHDVVGRLKFSFFLNTTSRTEWIGLLHDIFVDENFIVVFNVSQRYNCVTLTFWRILVFLFRMGVIISRLFLTRNYQLAFLEALALPACSYFLHGLFESPDLFVDLLYCFIIVLLPLVRTFDLAK